MGKIDNIVIDTNYFVALNNELDSTHVKARALSRKISFNIQIIITNYIFSEVMTIVAQRVSKKAAVLAGKDILENPQVKIIHIDTELHKLTWDIFQNIARKNISFVDCSILAVMRTEGIRKLLTFDTEDFAPLRKKFKFSFF